MRAPIASLPQPAPLDAREIRSIFTGIMLAMFLAALDQTIIAAALPLISRDLGDVQNLPWVATAYLLAATTATPLYGKASDIYGRRVMLLLGIATFVAGSIACALAPSMLVLVLARGLQGLGGGGLISLSQTIIADIVSPKERGRYQVRIASDFWPPASPGLISAASWRRISTGRRSSGSMCRSGFWPSASPTACCASCRAMTGRIASTFWAPP